VGGDGDAEHARLGKIPAPGMMLLQPVEVGKEGGVYE
jgi:hypothetical protein